MQFDLVGPKTNDLLTANVIGAYDADDDPMTFQFDWYRNGQLIRTTTTTSTSDTLDLSQAGNGDKGDIISCTVTPSDPFETGSPVSATTVVANSAPIVWNNAAALAVLRNTLSDPIDFGQLASDADGDALVYSIVNAPSNGTAYHIGGSLWDYVSNPTYTGQDDIDFKANDGSADSNVGTFALDITNEAPTAESTGTYKVLKNRTILISDLATYGNSFSTETLTPIIVDGPTHGVLTSLGNGQFEYAAPDYVTADTFTFKLSDGIDESTVVTATIDVVDEALVVNNVHLPIVGDDPITFTAAELIAKAQSALASPTFEVVSVSAPTLGQIVDNGDGTWTYTPPGDAQNPFEGQDAFTFSISDGVNVANANFTVLVPLRDSAAQHEIRRADRMMRSTSPLFPGNVDLDTFNAMPLQQRQDYTIRLANDIEQGYRGGDAAFTSALVAMIQRHTAASIFNMVDTIEFEPGEVVGYRVRFYGAQGEAVYVDVPIPTRNDFMRYGATREGGAWYTIIEMAYFQQFRLNQPDPNMVTVGYGTPCLQPAPDPLRAEAAIKRLILSAPFGYATETMSVPQAQLDALTTQLRMRIDLMTTATHSSFSADQQQTATNRGVVAQHTYAVVELLEEGENITVILQDPHRWGAISLTLAEYRFLFASLTYARSLI